MWATRVWTEHNPGIISPSSKIPSTTSLLVSVSNLYEKLVFSAFKLHSIKFRCIDCNPCSMTLSDSSTSRWGSFLLSYHYHNMKLSSNFYFIFDITTKLLPILCWLSQHCYSFDVRFFGALGQLLQDERWPWKYKSRVKLNYCAEICYTDGPIVVLLTFLESWRITWS